MQKCGTTFAGSLCDPVAALDVLSNAASIAVDANRVIHRTSRHAVANPNRCPIKNSRTGGGPLKNWFKYSARQVTRATRSMMVPRRRQSANIEGNIGLRDWWPVPRPGVN